MGYARAGFEVIGVDIEPQPHYPFEFHQADAMTVLDAFDDFCWAHGDFGAIHASPPCQVFSVATQHARGNHEDLLTPTRERLLAQPVPWVIENVPGAPMRADYKLCGCMFGLGRLRRERWFETSWHGFDLRPACYHPEPAITITTKGQPNRTGYAAEAAEAMGIDWMDMRERGLAIPPAYTEFIGAQLMAASPFPDEGPVPGDGDEQALPHEHPHSLADGADREPGLRHDLRDGRDAAPRRVVPVLDPEADDAC